MSDKLKIIEYINKLNGDGYGEDGVIECVVECSDEVWADSYIDEHRWYSLQEVVVDYKGLLIKFEKYMIQGDNGMGDMGLEYDLDDFTIVEKKTRVVTETYYE